MVNWIIGGIVAAAVVLACWVMIRDKKAGKGSCGGDCSRCSGGCHR